MPHAVIGGSAVSLVARPRTTKDVDMLAFPDESRLDAAEIDATLRPIPELDVRAIHGIGRTGLDSRTTANRARERSGGYAGVPRAVRAKGIPAGFRRVRECT
ncbi:MAG: hypothetical protein ACT4PV_07905 [Planctomycetaceae bacterium]